MPDQTPEDECQALELERIELDEQRLALQHELDMQDLAARRARITDDLAKLAEIQDARAATIARIEALDPDIRDYNSRARAHMGHHPDGPDIPQGLKDFVAARFPGAIVIEFGGGSFPFGGIDLTYAQAAGFLRNLPPFPDNAPEETEPFCEPTDAVDAPAASWFDENQHQGFGPG